MKPPGTCRDCGAKVNWVDTVKGNRMSLQLEPSPAGNVMLDASGRAVVLGRNSTAEGTRYVCHFDVCPSRRPGGARPAAPRAGGPPAARGARAGNPPPRAPSAAEFVDAIRSTAWTIKCGAEPQQTAVAMLHAATQVLLEGGRTVAQVQDLIARGAR